MSGPAASSCRIRPERSRSWCCPFGVPGSRLPLLAKLPELRLVQLMSAGAERVIPHVPPGATLCNARGAHDPAVAEWIMAVILAQMRLLPAFARAQQAGTWVPAAGEPLTGQTVLIVGYGSIGAATERLLAPFGVTVERVARRPRQGVSSIDDLPALLPRADIVILLVPVTPATVHLADARFLGLMHDHALLVNAARGAVVDTDALLAELPLVACGPRSTSPTPSRSRPGIRSGPRRACC